MRCTVRCVTTSSGGRPDASDDDMLARCKRAEAHDFVQRLTDPKGRMGYDAHVGERGVIPACTNASALRDCLV